MRLVISSWTFIYIKCWCGVRSCKLGVFNIHGNGLMKGAMLLIFQLFEKDTSCYFYLYFFSASDWNESIRFSLWVIYSNYESFRVNLSIYYNDSIIWLKCVIRTLSHKCGENMKSNCKKKETKEWNKHKMDPYEHYTVCG